MIKTECDRCGNQAATERTLARGNLGGLVRIGDGLPEGWHRVAVPEDGTGSKIWELCTECVNALREFLSNPFTAPAPDAFRLDIGQALTDAFPLTTTVEAPDAQACPNCGSRFTGPDMTKHMQEEHNGGGGVTRCAYCKGNPQVANPLFRKHMNQEHPGAPDDPEKTDAVCRNCGAAVYWNQERRRWWHVEIGCGVPAAPIPRDEYERDERP